MSYELLRTSQGLLYHGPFAAALGSDFTALEGGATWSTASGQLQVVSSGAGFFHLELSAVAGRQDAYIQVGARSVLGSAIGIYARKSGASLYSLLAGGTPDGGVTWQTAFWADDTSNLSSSLDAVNPTSALRRYNFLIRGAIARCWKEGTARASGAGLTVRSGTTGLEVYAAGAGVTMYFDDLYECTDAIITGTGLPAGYQLRIGSTVSTTSTGTSDTVSLDAEGLAMPFATVEVLDELGNVVGTFTGDTDYAFAAGGDAFTWTDTTPYFLRVAGIPIYVEGTQAQELESETGGQPFRVYGGALRTRERWRKRAWQFGSIEMDEADYQALRTALAAPGIVDCDGLALNSETVSCFVWITAAPYTRQPDGTHKRTVTLSVREV